jgi:hypothetical protein
MAFTEGVLGQLRPANTTAASLYSPAASTIGIGKTLTVCNTSGAAATFRIFVDNDGTTYDETTAIFWDISIAADETVQLDGFYPMNNAAGNLAVRTSVANALTFTLFGAEVT